LCLHLIKFKDKDINGGKKERELAETFLKRHNLSFLAVINNSRYIGYKIIKTGYTNI
jgi:hypothetical protein